MKIGRASPFILCILLRNAMIITCDCVQSKPPPSPPSLPPIARTGPGRKCRAWQMYLAMQIADTGLVNNPQYLSIPGLILMRFSTQPPYKWVLFAYLPPSIQHPPVVDHRSQGGHCGGRGPRGRERGRRPPCVKLNRHLQ